jgi:signal transduction histidine kinase
MTGTDGASTYTRATMERGILGGPRRADADALYTEASAALAQGASQLRALSERLRVSITDDLTAPVSGGSPSDDDVVPGMREEHLARARGLLARLDLTVEDLDESRRFLERGLDGDPLAGVPQASDERSTGLGGTALRILEAQERERARIAEELHDGPAQVLANAAFQVEIVDRALRADPAAAASELRRLRAILDVELVRIRGFIHQLRPALDEAGGLDGALADAAERLTDETGIRTWLDLNAPESALDLPRRTAVVRVAQEALRNARKHSAASEVRVSTRLVDEHGNGRRSWLLEVSDDGRGFNVVETSEQRRRKHFGLRFMRERAQLVGAELEIDSGIAAGTTVRLRFREVARD